MNTSSLGLFIIVLILAFNSCKSREEQEEAVARSYCSSCHIFPEPLLLDKETWKKSVLPQMAFHMGFSDYEIMSKIPEQDLTVVLKSLPARPMVTDQQWNMITNYYLTHSPDSLPSVHQIISDSIKLFSIKPLSLFPNQLITLIKIDTANQLVYVGNRLSQLIKLNSDLVPTDTVSLTSPPSCIKIFDRTSIISTMGIMDPNDQSKGQIVSIRDHILKELLDSLKRPVHFDEADFNNDGTIDFVVCSFGNFTGDLSIYGATTDGYEKHIISQAPGARKTVVKDFNNDNRPDILALMTQGNEQLVLYINEGNFHFGEKVLLRFPPVYGTTYFEIADFNGDGFFDVLIANGDNADYSSILKPYHGIRIFENDGKNNFHEAYFFPMPGASMAMARDFDQDGDLDVVAISFFPDFENAPEGSIVYLQNENRNYQFSPQTTKLAKRARWLVMDAGDYDFDGDCDVIIGAMNFKGLGASQEDYESWLTQKTSLLVLRNKLFEK
ncbi:MAG TPA: VCBS repeat-containing protein [Cyclobacteriaceae bacterium]|nr:VCBS repeat-containing protein [Cyclobacteriaceae bacterium]